MRAARIAWTVAGTWMACTGPVSRYAPRSPASAFVSTSVRTLSSRKNGIALGPLDQELLERRRARHRRRAARRAARRRSRAAAGSSRSWRVVGLAAPGVLVLGAVVDEEQQPRRRQAVDQAVEQRLGLGVDPVEVLEDHEQRLDLALAQQQALDGVERPLAALGRVEGLPRGVLDGHVEQRQERRAASAPSAAVERQRACP